MFCSRPPPIPTPATCGISPHGDAISALAFTFFGFPAIHSTHEPFYLALPYLAVAALLAEWYVRTGRSLGIILLAVAWGTHNLNKVAHLHHVEVLNINDLANALKPVVLPGERMNVLILKEGKEYNQGVGYLDDGTMVVVDHARKLIGKSIDISVTSVLQTASGKMIFGKLDENGRNGEAA